MNKTYGRINWENYPSDETPLNESNLNKIDVATDEIDNRVITLDTTKATKEEVSTLVQDVVFEEKTGIITITKKNGSKITIDTQMEKIAVNFSYNAKTQQIILTLIDGTRQYIDLSALITQYEFLDSDTVAFSIDSAGKVSAIVKEASIQEKHLQPNYLADIKVEVAKAQASQSAAKSESNAKASETAATASESNAAASATKAQSYATGGTNSRTGEDTDNAKYYSQQSAQSQSAAAISADTASTKAEEAAASAATAKTSADNAAGSANLANEKANSAANSATIAVSNSNAAQQYASNAAASANTAQNYAVADTDSAKYYYEQARRISESFSGALRPMGTVTFANLPALSEADGGSMYNISDQFTTTAEFKEGAGNTIPAGANVYKTEDGKWDVLAGTPVTGVKGSAESEYRRGNVNITAENVGAIPAGGNAGSAATVQDYNDTSKKIKVGWVGNSLSQDQILGVACYASGDDDIVKAKIKDVSKATFKNWLGTVSPSDGSNNYVKVFNSSNVNSSDDLTVNDLADQGFAAAMIAATEDSPIGSGWFHALNLGWGNSKNNWVSQIALGTQPNDGLYYRTTGASIVGKPWKRVLDSSNYTNYALKNENLSNVDLNNVTTTGIYHLTGNLTNSPLSCNATLFVDFNVGTPYQIFIPDYTYAMYKRTYSNSSWDGWQEINANTWRPQPDWNATSGDAMIKNKPSLGTAAKKNIRTLASVGSSGWQGANVDQNYVPDMAFIARWNGAYSGSTSNLTYCNKGAFGTAAVANKTDFATANHTHAYLPLAGGTMTGALNMNGNSVKLFGNNYMQANEQDINIIAGGKDMFTGYINARVTSALQVRDTANTAWKPINALSFNQQSSRRYKKNIEDMPEEEARKVLQYRVVDYDYINEADGTNCQGLIAEEVAEICEYPVYRKLDGTIEGLDYSKFVPQLIKMVQLQQEQIERLEQKIEEIKQKL
jgi:hypothetical protein